MPNIEESAQTNIDNLETSSEEINNVNEIADIDKENQQETNDIVFTDTKDSSNDDLKKSEDVKKVQDARVNAEYAHRRREQEAKARLEKVEAETRLKTLIELTDGINPYTHEPIKDKVDAQKYLVMREIEKSGGDPISDYHKVQSKKEKEEIASQQKAEAEKDWYANDRKNFFEKNPNLTDKDLSKLLTDEQFLNYGDGKFGNKPLAEIYDNYQKVIMGFENKAKSMAEQLFAQKQSSPGSLNNSNAPVKHDYASMSDEEFEICIQKAKNGELMNK